MHVILTTANHTQLSKLNNNLNTLLFCVIKLQVKYKTSDILPIGTYMIVVWIFFMTCP